jgi:Lectin C-type domain
MNRQTRPLFYVPLAACLIIPIATTTLSGAPVQWPSSSGGNDHYYEAFAVPDGISWPDANAAASSSGGYLATITSSAENDFVFALINSAAFWKNVGADSRGPWLGAFQPPGSDEPAGGWQWVTGEPFAFTNWAAGEPNNFFDESSLHYLAQGNDNTASTWNDLVADTGVDNPLGYIVETVPEPTSIVLMTLATCALAFGRLTILAKSVS